MKVRALVLASQGKLREFGIENPARDARLLLANCLAIDIHKLNLLDDRVLSKDEVSKLTVAIFPVPAFLRLIDPVAVV